MTGRAIWLLVLCASLPACAARAAPDNAMHADAKTHCRFLVPDDMADGAAAWIGACDHGVADGPGVLRVAVAGQDAQLFAGVMRAGRPVQGIVDKGRAGDSDYGPAYAFDGRHAVYAKSRAETVAGFQAASRGAEAASAAYRQQGNAASAKFYDGWSHALTSAPDSPE
jgi:hypothetical protein